MYGSNALLQLLQLDLYRICAKPLQVAPVPLSIERTVYLTLSCWINLDATPTSNCEPIRFLYLVC